MTISVGVNPPKTPVTEGSLDMAPATMPNVCKMLLPSGAVYPDTVTELRSCSADRLTDATTLTVFIEGKKIAIKGSYYMSRPSPDVASKGTGGGIVSSSTEGKTEFAAPGSMNVKAEGANIQLLGDAMTNNGGSPANSATLPGNQQAPSGLTFGKNMNSLCSIFCECLGQWQAHHGEVPIGVTDSELETIYDPEFESPAKAHRFERQGCVEQQLREHNDPSIVPEQRYDMSQSPPLPGEGGPGRIPDVVVLAAAGPASGTNITAVVEMKFPGDDYRPGQQQAYQRIAQENNPDAVFVHMDKDECECEG